MSTPWSHSAAGHRQRSRNPANRALDLHALVASLKTRFGAEYDAGSIELLIEEPCTGQQGEGDVDFWATLLERLKATADGRSARGPGGHVRASVVGPTARDARRVVAACPCVATMGSCHREVFVCSWDDGGVVTSPPSRSSPMLLCVLGPVSVVDRHGGRSVFGSRSSRLLAWLLLHHPGGVGARASARSLWPDLPDDLALNELRRRMSDLRHELAQLPTTTPNDAIAVGRRAGRIELLVPHGVDRDAELFAGLTERAGHELGAGHPAAARATIERALALWRDEVPFVEVVHLPEAVDATVQLMGFRRDAELLRGAARLHLGGDIALIADLSADVERHPTDELAWRQLAVALARAGQRAAALRALDRCRRELGHVRRTIDAATARLEARLVSGESVPVVDVASTPVAEQPPSQRLVIQIARSDDIEPDTLADALLVGPDTRPDELRKMIDVAHESVQRVNVVVTEADRAPRPLLSELWRTADDPRVTICLVTTDPGAPALRNFVLRADEIGDRSS